MSTNIPNEPTAALLLDHMTDKEKAIAAMRPCAVFNDALAKLG